MKKILSLLLVGIMVVSMVPTAFATTNYTNGTDVEYDAANDDTIGDINGDGQPDNTEYYTVTVPALMAPGASGNVVAQGTWASNRKLTVTADEDITLTNSINAADQKVLDVTFPGIELAGSNTAAVTDTKAVSVAGIDNALFGTWSGTFYYDVEMVDFALITFTIDGTEYQAEEGMTWGEWCDSEYNTDGYVIVEVYNTAWQLDFQIVMNASKTLMVGQMSMDYSTGEMGLGALGNDIKIDDDGTYLVGDLSDYFTL